MGVFVLVFIVIGIVIFRNMKAAAEQEMQRQKRAQEQERTRMTSNYTPALNEKPAKPAQPPQQVPGQMHFGDVLPDNQPPAVPVRRDDARMEFKPTEGVAFHPPGFHGDEKPEVKSRVSGSMEKKPLEKTDLGADRARQNAHTAQNLSWTAPAEETVQRQPASAQRKPMFTAQQLRNAFIMQEILDEPVSRRKEKRRGYGS